MSSFATKHILIMDEQENWRNALRVLLENEGYQVSAVSSSQEAKDALTHRFDLAVLDVRLDEEQVFNVEGLELLQRIKAHTPSMKTIILTGYPENIKGKPDADEVFFKVPDGSTFDSKSFKEKVCILLETSKELIQK